MNKAYRTYGTPPRNHLRMWESRNCRGGERTGKFTQRNNERRLSKPRAEDDDWIHEAPVAPDRLHMERSLWGWTVSMLPKVNNRDDFESKKRRMACHIHKTVRVFLSRSLVGHERVQ